MYVAITVIFSAMTGSVNLDPTFANITFRIVPIPTSHVHIIIARSYIGATSAVILGCWLKYKQRVKLIPEHQALYIILLMTITIGMTSNFLFKHQYISVNAFKY